MSNIHILKSEIISDKFKKNNCNHWYIKCKCVCGKILEQRFNRAGAICKNCRAKYYPPPKKQHENLVGKKFSTRLVTNQYYNEKDQQVYVDVLCDCGNKYTTRKYTFKHSKYCPACKYKYRYEHKNKYFSDGKNKTCYMCKKNKSINMFHKDSRRKDKLYRFCKECVSIYNRSKKYNIETSKIINSKKCEICNNDQNIYIDHCHLTNKFRGFLCRECNFGLGNFKDSILLLKKSIKYLEKNNDKS